MVAKIVHLHSTGHPELDDLLDNSPQQVLAAAHVLMAVVLLDEDLGNRVLKRLEREHGPYLDDLGPGDNEADSAMSRRWADLFVKLNLLDG